MTVRKNILSAVSAIALLVGAPAAVAEDKDATPSTDLTNVSVNAGADATTDNSNFTDADVIQRSGANNPEARINQRGSQGDDTRAAIEQESGANQADAVINQDQKNTLGLIEQNARNAEANIHQNSGGAGDSWVAIDQNAGANRADADVVQTSSNSAVDVEQNHEDALADVRQFGGGHSNLVDVDQNSTVANQELNADVWQKGTNATAVVKQ